MIGPATRQKEQVAVAFHRCVHDRAEHHQPQCEQLRAQQVGPSPVGVERSACARILFEFPAAGGVLIRQEVGFSDHDHGHLGHQNEVFV